MLELDMLELYLVYMHAKYISKRPKIHVNRTMPICSIFLTKVNGRILSKRE